MENNSKNEEVKDNNPVAQETVNDNSINENSEQKEIYVEEELTEVEIEETLYEDGEYAGEHKAIGVKVTIRDGKISNIEITKNKQTPEYYEDAVKIITEEIIETQTTVVEGITGSTSTSTNLKEAVNVALEKAKIIE